MSRLGSEDYPSALLYVSPARVGPETRVHKTVESLLDSQLPVGRYLLHT